MGLNPFKLYGPVRRLTLEPLANVTTGLTFGSNPVAGYGLGNWSQTLLKFTRLRIFVPSAMRSILNPRSLFRKSVF